MLSTMAGGMVKTICLHDPSSALGYLPSLACISLTQEHNRNPCLSLGEGGDTELFTALVASME